MQVDKHTIRLILIVIIVILIMAIAQRYLGETMSDIITIGTAVFGVVSILYQLKKDYQISKAEFIYSLNDSFSNNEDITYIYMKLKAYRDNHEQILTEEDGRKMGDYVMFFEIMAYLQEEKMITIDMMDKIFANKFFIFANNPYVQEYQMKYSEINRPLLELYCTWYNYRLKKGLRELYPDNSFSLYHDYCIKDSKGRLSLNEAKMAIGY